MTFAVDSSPFSFSFSSLAYRAHLVSNPMQVLCQTDVGSLSAHIMLIAFLADFLYVIDLPLFPTSE